MTGCVWCIAVTACTSKYMTEEKLAEWKEKREKAVVSNAVEEPRVL